MKLHIIVGTRPEIIRLSETIKLARNIFNVTLIHTGQNYDYQLNEVFFQDLSLENPDVYLECDMKNLGTSVGSIIQKSYEYFKENKPDCILVLGDTNSCLCSYSAKRLKIPIFHIEAGNRCFDPNVPEEVNRKIIDHLADVNMCYMEHARRNLLQEGLSSKYLFVIGSPIPEILNTLNFEESDVLNKLKLKEKEYFVVSTHREENINIKNNFQKVIESINKIAETFNKKIVFTVHPRTRKMLEEKKINFNNKLILSKPFGIKDYYKLQKNAKCVISDSGTVTEESSVLKFPAVLLRTSTEHPEGVDSGNIVIGNIKPDDIVRNINLAINTKFNKISNYKDSNFSQKVCNIISGYTDIVNKFIWMK